MRTRTLLAALLGSSFALGGCRRDSDQDPTPSASAALPKVRVRVVKPKKEASSGNRVFPGVLLPWQKASLGARVAGELSSLSVDRGDHVKKGQVLATIAIPGIKQEVERAAALEKSAEAELSLIEDQQKRTAEVVQNGPRGAIAEAEVAALETKSQVARAKIAATEADRARSSAMLRDTTVVAPFDGVVVARHADPGTALTVGARIVEVADLATLRLAIDVPERDAAAVRVGALVSVISPSVADRKIAAKVARFAPALDEATRTLRVEIDVPNMDGSVLAGITARAAIDFGSHGDAWTLPADAISQDGAEAFVFVMEGETARKRKVAVSYDRGPTVEIAEGLKGDEEVVVGGRGLVKDGTVCEVAR